MVLRRRRGVLAAVAILGSGATSACHEYRQLESPPTVPSPPQAPPATAGAVSWSPAGTVSDESIVRTTRRELGRYAATAGENVGLDSAHGVVTLRGPLRNRLAKRRAVDIAHAVRGVRAIVDRTFVVARPRPDHVLDFAAARALSLDPVTAGQPIAPRTERSVVLLSGKVASNAARRAAEDDVLALPGVLDTVDDIVIVPARRTDARVAAEVERSLEDDPWLDASHVTVEVRTGVVRLGGWVGSAAERSRAEDDARAASPARLDLAALRVDQFIDDGTLRPSPHFSRLDGDLEQSLLDAVVLDPRVYPFVPTVDVHDGVVALTGVAANETAARALDEDARAVPGVLAVRDYVKTLPGVYEQSDTAILEQVGQELLQDPRLRSVNVEVVRGRVFLRGTVASSFDRLRAVSIAASAPGARDVDDGLVVVPAPAGD